MKRRTRKFSPFLSAMWAAFSMSCATPGTAPYAPSSPADTHRAAAGPPEAEPSSAEDRSSPASRDDAVEQSVAASPKGYDALLSGYDYPFPVQRFEFESQGQKLTMAYMLLEPEVEPEGATGAKASPPTVTLLHGKNFSGAYWKTTADALTKAGYRVLVPDQIGFGKSSKPIDFQYSFFELGRHTMGLWNELDIEESVVVGHSMGGMLATRLALMAPHRATSLVLVNPIGLEDWKRVVPYRSIDEWTAQNEESTPAGIRAYMRSSYFDGQWKPEYDELVEIQAGWATGPDSALIARVSALHYDMIFTQPVVHEFVDVTVPTLLVIGQRDRTALGKNWVTPAVAKTLGDYPKLGRAAHRAIRDSQLVELPGVGHIPQVESYGEWIQALLGFLTEI